MNEMRMISAAYLMIVLMVLAFLSLCYYNCYSMWDIMGIISLETPMNYPIVST